MIASVSTASFEKDFRHGQAYDYPGPHGVTLYADYAAYQDFLDHLGGSGAGSGSTAEAPATPVARAPRRPVHTPPRRPVSTPPPGSVGNIPLPPVVIIPGERPRPEPL